MTIRTLVIIFLRETLIILAVFFIILLGYWITNDGSSTPSKVPLGECDTEDGEC